MELVRAAAEEPETPHPGAHFSPARALEAVGERWSLLIMREAVFRDVTRFSEFERRVLVERDILAARLHGFVGAGLMAVRSVPGSPGEHEYVLTRNGRNLEPVIVALSTWADGWSVAPLVERGHPASVFEGGLAIAPTHSSLHTGPHAIPPAAEKADEAAVTEPVVIEIRLLGTFDLRVGGAGVPNLAVGSQRLLAFLALHDRAVARIAMAGAMWPEVSDERASISLRSALSRLDPSTRDAILSASPSLSLAEAVVVDLRDGQALARRLLSTAASGHPDSDLSPAAIALLSLELLPDWYDDWVVAEAEDWRQLRMSALEALAGILAGTGRLAEAAEAARAAMKAEPLRESAHASLIRVHIAAGNQSEALRVYDRYRSLLRSVLDLEPTPMISGLVAGLRR
jgi:DNA-binding SARP family transcriptional activator/DNA-binding HxlR family transcriptional regulator